MKNSFKLANGTQIPAIGFGTYKIPDGEDAYNSVKAALACGYRHIDTASLYGNEESVGRAIRDSGIAREDIWVTSKVWDDDQGYDKAKASIENSLKRLDIGYIDLMLIHWPIPEGFEGDWAELNLSTWRAFEEAYKEGKLRAIGVSNFMPKHLKPLLAKCEIAPMVNQMEIHPTYPQKETVDFCQNRGIVMEAWAPLGRAQDLEDPTINAVAAIYNKTPAQICLRWAYQHGIVTLPKSTHIERIRDNRKIFDFEIHKNEMELLDSLPDDKRISRHPDNLPR